MRRDSWRSVPNICRPPAASTSLRSTSISRTNFRFNPFQLFGRQHFRRLAVFLQTVFEQHVGIAAQQNIGAASGHVGGNRNGAFAAGLRHNMRFAFVIFGVEHFVADAHLLEYAGKMLRFLHGNGAHQNRLALFMKRS